MGLYIVERLVIIYAVSASSIQSPYERLYVRQSVQDICAALDDDCGDAIEASQGPQLDLRTKPN